MILEMRYTTNAKVVVSLSVQIPRAAFAGGEEYGVSPDENLNLVDSAAAQAMPQLSALISAIMPQVHSILLQSYNNSLKRYIKENAPPLDSTLASAFAGEQRRQ